MPAGCIFGDKGPAAFVQHDEPISLLALAAVMNSRVFGYLVSIQLARTELAQAYEVGLIQRTPVPDLAPADQSALAAPAQRAWSLKRSSDTRTETSHAFTLPALLQVNGDTLAMRSAAWGERVHAADYDLAAIQAEIDARCFDLYGINEADRHAITHGIGGLDTASGEHTVPEADVGNEDETQAAADTPSLVAELTSWAIGVSFACFDVRLATGTRPLPPEPGPFDPLPVCSPAMLVGPYGLPAQPNGIVSVEWLRARSDAITLPSTGLKAPVTIPDAEYPLRIAWDGILVDDPEHRDDVVRRVREVFHVLWGDRAEAMDQEACEILGVRELREYFRRPSLFFADHLKRYSKSRRQAPIYWPLSTASGSYTLWIYYHRLTSDTLYTAVNRYVQPKMAEVSRELEELNARLQGASGRQATRLREAIEGRAGFLRELTALRDELLRVAGLPYRPNLDDGVIINAAPLQALFRLPKWAKDTRETWAKLERGDYDWAHLAYTIWSDRVREKCRTDRSLAIGHDLEHLYVAPSASLKKGRGRRATATVNMEEP
jgi:hypothetical protein